MNIKQLMHPGKETSKGIKIKRYNCYFKHWNDTKNHRRKYICANGDYIKNNEVYKNENITFWGEWEAESIALKVSNDNKPPCYKHIPVFIPRKKRGKFTTNKFVLKETENRLNTDPFVFGNKFYYSICQRERVKPQKDDIILFGSVKEKTKFQIDTVFVVDDNQKPLNDEFYKDNKIFKEVTIDRLNDSYCINKKKIISSVCVGRMYDGTNSTYSYVPFKISDENHSFERLEIDSNCKDKIFDNITFHYNTQGYAYVNTQDREKFWYKLKEYAEKKGFCFAIRLDLPKTVEKQEDLEKIMAQTNI